MPAGGFARAADQEEADHVGETRRCRGLPLVDARIDGGGKVVAIPWDLEHRPRPLIQVGGPPPEYWRVERHRGLAVGGVQVTEVPCARCDGGDVRAATGRELMPAGHPPA